MLDVLEKLLKEYKKNAQKTKVRTIGRSGVASTDSFQQAVKLLGKQESESAKSSISKATAGLQATVKGQYGKKVTDVLDKQKKTLNDF